MPPRKPENSKLILCFGPWSPIPGANVNPTKINPKGQSNIPFLYAPLCESVLPSDNLLSAITAVVGNELQAKILMPHVNQVAIKMVNYLEENRDTWNRMLPDRDFPNVASLSYVRRTDKIRYVLVELSNHGLDSEPLVVAAAAKIDTASYHRLHTAINSKNLALRNNVTNRRKLNVLLVEKYHKIVHPTEPSVLGTLRPPCLPKEGDDINSLSSCNNFISLLFNRERDLGQFSIPESSFVGVETEEKKFRDRLSFVLTDRDRSLSFLTQKNQIPYAPNNEKSKNHKENFVSGAMEKEIIETLKSKLEMSGIDDCKIMSEDSLYKLSVLVTQDHRELVCSHGFNLVGTSHPSVVPPASSDISKHVSSQKPSFSSVITSTHNKNPSSAFATVQTCSTVLSVASSTSSTKNSITISRSTNEDELKKLHQEQVRKQQEQAAKEAKEKEKSAEVKRKADRKKEKESANKNKEVTKKDIKKIINNR